MKAALFLASLILLTPVAGTPVSAWELPRALADGCTPWVLESTDGGVIWHPPEPPPPSSQSHYDAGPTIVVHPRRPEIVFLATAEGLFARRNQSGRWRHVYVDDDWRCTAALLIDPLHPRRMHLMSCVNGKLRQTADGGRRWRRRYSVSDDVFAFDIDFRRPSTLYVASHYQLEQRPAVCLQHVHEPVQIRERTEDSLIREAEGRAPPRADG